MRKITNHFYTSVGILALKRSSKDIEMNPFKRMDRKTYSKEKY